MRGAWGWLGALVSGLRAAIFLACTSASGGACDIEEQRAGAGRAAPLEQIDAEHAASCGGECEPQGGGRGAGPLAERTEEESQRVVAGGSNLQAANLPGVDARAPGEHAAEGAAGKGVFHRP